ncbi:hypothetical protein Dimus_036071 [Dionaea muscipula]
MEVAMELFAGMVHRESDLNMDLKEKGARVVGVPTGASPPVFHPVLTSSADSGGLRMKLTEGEGGAVGAFPDSASSVSYLSAPLPIVVTELGQQPITLVKSLVPTVEAIAIAPAMAHSLSRPATLLAGHYASPVLYGDGMMSEEGRVMPVAREALRPQPTDGLRQPSSAPVEPVSGVESRGGRDGCSGGRSYAHVVQVQPGSLMVMGTSAQAARENVIAIL